MLPEARWTRRLSGRPPDRIGRTPAQGIHHGHRYTAGCEAHPEDVPGRLREGRVWQGLGASGPAAYVRLAAVRRWHGDREDRTVCWPCQQPCHRDRVPTRAHNTEPAEAGFLARFAQGGVFGGFSRPDTSGRDLETDVLQVIVSVAEDQQLAAIPDDVAHHFAGVDLVRHSFKSWLDGLVWKAATALSPCCCQNPPQRGTPTDRERRSGRLGYRWIGHRSGHGRPTHYEPVSDVVRSIRSARLMAAGRCSHGRGTEAAPPARPSSRQLQCRR
jgi:hypothetical protein